VSRLIGRKSDQQELPKVKKQTVIVHEHIQNQHDNMAMQYESSDEAEFYEDQALSKVPNVMRIGKVDSINYYGQPHDTRKRF